MKEIEQEIGIYTDIYPTGENDKYGQRICHAKCKICETVVYKPINYIRRNHKICNHIDKTTYPDIGIYTDIHTSGKVDKSGNKMYYATCKICGTIVEKKLDNIKRSHIFCRHKRIGANNIVKINDMPKGWMNESKLNARIYDIWKGMLYRTTQKCWDKYPTYEGTTVDESWRTLSIFVNDIKYLRGYDEWVNAPNKSMMLDKDTLVEGNKHYSKDTCCFISALESIQDVNRRHPDNTEKARMAFVEKYSEPVKIINTKNGAEKTFNSFSDVCRIMGWNKGNAWMAFSDKYPSNHTIKGWKIVRV